MLEPSEISARRERHEEIFMARYARLRAWALQLAENDRERAEDLVHDAFIHFTFTRPDLARVENLDGYLYRTLRNLHVSQLRRMQRLQSRSLSILEYDSAESGLRATEAQDQLRVQDELRACCRYACMRKETSKAGSVLILRFLHGYYPREIALLMQSSRQAVEERLRVARSEARQYLKDPASLRFMPEAESLSQTGAPQPPQGFVQTSDELLRDLRSAVFNSRRGECVAPVRLKSLYRETAAGIDTPTLAHLASCPRCIDEVNKTLALPLLAERYPTDVLDKDTHSRGGDGGGSDDGGDGDGGATGAGSEEVLRRLRRRAQDVFEHRPQELCITVNGHLLAAQKIGAAVNEQTLSVRSGEKVEFVEVFSEQEVRLLFLDAAGPQGEGNRQLALARLSDDRTLEATLVFDGPWPTVQVVYHDPLLAPEGAAQTASAEEAPPALREVSAGASGDATTRGNVWGAPGVVRTILSAAARVGRGFLKTDFWLRPATASAVVAMILVAALLFVRTHVPVVSAAELLRRSAQQEETLSAGAGRVTHRTLYLEERKPGASDVLSMRRIETWQSAERGVRLRRVYDERGNLIAGAWTRADGTHTVYRPGLAPVEQTAPDAEAKALLASGDVWRIDLSPKDFSTLVGAAENLSVEDAPGSYVIDYRADSTDDAAQARTLQRATLRLNKANLRAFTQTLVVGRGDAAREYRFIEGGFEQLPSEKIAPQVFEPDAGLLAPPAEGAKQRGESVTPVDSTPETAGEVRASAPVAASTELEIEVTYLLNRIKANLGEQVSMTRATGGQIRVEALVETGARKEEILRALSPVINNPAVVVQISTVDEALKRRAANQTSRGETVREVEVRAGRVPGDAELRRYFSARVAGDAGVDEEIGRFAARVMNRSRQALLHASALRRLVGRFTPAEVRALAPEARTKWLGMLDEHARAYRREVARLGDELRPVFAQGGQAGEGARERIGEGNLSQAAERLLQLSYSHDAAVRSALTVSADAGTSSQLKSQQFWRSLRAAENLAAAIQAAYQ
ncbi:MAG TPA: sigma factor [Pyrinomonadaceae bacterium]|nr:sigma factor [Pyrinomonadaceae bacterium]